MQPESETEADDTRLDRPSPSEAMIEFVKALARVREKIDYEEAKAAARLLAKKPTDR